MLPLPVLCATQELDLGSLDIGGTSLPSPDFLWYSRHVDGEVSASPEFSLLSRYAAVFSHRNC